MAQYVLQRGDAPLNRQLADQIQKRILDGRFATGTRLPTVRAMASDTGVSRVTVLQAYDLLRIRGLVETKVGAGTYVREPKGVGSGSPRLRQFSPCAIVSDYEETAKAGNIVSLAIHSADDSMFHEDDFIAGAIPRNGQANFVDHLYGDPNLVSALVGHYRSLGVAVPHDEILVTGGGVAANAVIASVLGKRGGTFIVQEPLFPYVESYLESFGCKPVGVPKIDGNIDTDHLEKCLKGGDARAIFVEMAHDSATGLPASLSNKQEVIRLAEKYRVPIIEDVSGIWWRHTDSERPATLWELGADVDIVACDCFTKTISSSVAIGCVFVAGQLRDQLAIRAMGWGSRPPKILQRALADYIATRKLAALMARASSRYTKRRDALLRALDTTMPAGAQWTTPVAGLSLWLTLPSPISDENLYAEALKVGVAVAPGCSFMTPLRPTSSVRLAFGNATKDEIERAVPVLADVVRNLLKRRN